MKKEATMLRGWRSLGERLQALLNNGFAVVRRDTQGRIMFGRWSLKRTAAGFLGLYPTHSLHSHGEIPVERYAAIPIDAAKGALAKELVTMPQMVRVAAARTLKESGQARLGHVGEQSGQAIERIMGEFAQHLDPFLKGDRNSFRRNLLEGLGVRGSDIFVDIARKHLGELMMRVRDELEEGSSSRQATMKAGPIALPAGTRFYVQKGNMTVFVIEQQPQARTLKIMENNGEKSELFTLHFPFVIFFVVLRGRRSDDMHAFFSKKPLRSMGDPLLCPGLPNVYSDFRVCFSPSSAKDTQAEMAEASIDSFWGGRFIRSHDPGNLARQISIEKWADGSRADALFGLHYTWRAANKTVGEVLQSIDADFLKKRNAAKNTGDAAQQVSRLQGVIDSLGGKVALGLQETCFNLVPTWDMDASVLGKLRGALEDASRQFCSHAKVAAAEEAGRILSEPSIGAALEESTQRILGALNAGADRALEEAHHAIVSAWEARDVPST